MTDNVILLGQKHFCKIFIKQFAKNFIQFLPIAPNSITDYMQYKVNFGKLRMQHLCFLPSIYYQSFPINSYLFPMQTLQNNCYYVLYPTPLEENSQEISRQSIQSMVIMEERKNDDNGIHLNASSESENRKNRKIQRNQNFLNKTLIDQQFQVSIPIKKKGTIYKKKNTESNIINQTLSFINSQRSYPCLSILLQQNDQKIRWFYKVVAAIKKANKKYTNRKYLKRLIDFAERSEFHRVYLKQKNALLTINQMRILIRKLVLYFIRNHSYLSLMTSSKIFKETLREHFWRKTEILNFLFNYNKQEKQVKQ